MLYQARPQKRLRPLSPREENFVREYLVDLNGAKAAQRAGYSARGARVAASRLLLKPSVIEALQGLRDKQAKRLEVSIEKVLDVLAACAFSNMGDFWPSPGERIDLSKKDRRLTAAVSQIRIRETLIAGKDGEPALLQRTTELKLHNKIAALEALGKHLGLFAKPKRDSLEERVRRMTPDERVARMEQIMEIARQRYGHLVEDGRAAGEQSLDGSAR